MIKVEKINEEGKLISKEVEEDLLSIYLNTGWKIPNPKINVKQEINYPNKNKEEK